MAFVFKDVNGVQHELYNSMEAEKIIDVVTKDVVSYRVRGSMSNYEISKETYDAIIEARR